MNWSMTSTMSPEQIAFEVAEMRKAARAIAASPRKRLEFLRQVGVLDSVKKRLRPRHRPARSPRRD